MNANKNSLTCYSFKNRKTIRKHFDNFDLCFWPCPYGKQEIVFEGFVKVDGGIKHLVNRYEKISVTDAASDVIQYGFFSPRPYQLGQACDGSINDCALALFFRFCRDCGHCADALLRAAYPDERKIDWSDVVATADWQGVAYPKRWNRNATAGLLESLHEINYHSLASVVSDLSDKSCKESEVGCD